MGKKFKDILFKDRFHYSDDKSEYTFQLKRKKWWWLLLLLLPLLAVFKCDKEEKKLEKVLVHVIDRDTKDDIPSATIKWNKGGILKFDTNKIITDDYGIGILEGIDPSENQSIDIKAFADGYADTLYSDIHIPADLKDEGTIIIEMRPLKKDYHVDIVMCIDNTGSMSSLIQMVKDNALSFHSDLKDYCAKNGQIINEIRVRVIPFGDFDDSRYSDSGWLNIPEQTADFQHFVKGISLTSGGDNPEDGLEALAIAIGSSWDKKTSRRRHIILLYTDAPPHELGTHAASPMYPAGMPKNFFELTTMWDAMDNKARRLVLFAPDCDEWNAVSSKWKNVVHKKKSLDTVLSGKGYNDILKAISKSL